MSRAARALAAALACAACGAPPPQQRRAPPPPAAPKAVEDESVTAAPATMYVYSPIGKRDPFQNLSVPQGFGRQAQNSGRAKTPLEKWGLDQLRLSMTVTGTATPLAMVEDPDHRGWPVRLGDFIGQNGGKVTGIHRDELVITETITDHSTGRVYPQNVKLTVPVTRDEERDMKALQEGEHIGVATGEK